MLLSNEDSDNRSGKIAGSGARALARSRYVQHRDRMRFDELGGKRCNRWRVGRSRVNHQHRLLESVAESHGFERAASGRVEANHERPVRVDDVLPGALPVACAGKLGNGVAIGDPAILGNPAFRAPATAGKAYAQGRIQRAAVDARLTTGNDFLEHAAFYGLLGLYLLAAFSITSAAHVFKLFPCDSAAIAARA